MTGFMFWIALTGYFAGTLAYLAYLVLRRHPLARLALAVVALGFCAHVANYGSSCAASRAMVITSAHGSFSFLSLLIVLVLLVISIRHQLHILGAFVMPLGLAGMVAAAAASVPGPPETVLKGPLFPFHVILNFGAFAGFIAAFGVAVAYLIQDRQLKSRKPHTITYVLPPLDALDRLAARLALASLVSLGAGMAVGALYVHQTEGTSWFQDPKVYAACASFLMYAATLSLRFMFGWRGRRMALLLIAGFAMILLTLVGMSHLLPQDLLEP